ncbi:lytic murein transglycosylase [Phytohalomonas tamaricis]|uniref:lytic murein transglycosylase n=1 Tax=Phytohalomonas tamaricis TaxID=2081032 RepID=UPI0021D40CD3|nr:lytic murein transglycosylase [Phytohalomonas tamaricis]
MAEERNDRVGRATVGRRSRLWMVALTGAMIMPGCQANTAEPNVRAGSAVKRAATAETATKEAIVERGSGASDNSGTVRSSEAPPESAGDGTPAAQESFAQWLDEFRAYARSQGIDPATIDMALGGVSYQPRIIELDRYQPEFTRAIWQYLDSAVSASRIENGRAKLAAHRETAERMEARYGVPSSIVTAIWGVESNYGSNFGNFSTIAALATLGYEGRRHEFAREQLVAALKIIQRGDIDADHMRGSWAGAMGHTQFIPTSFLAYAVDGDGDDRRDIWGSIPDVMASTANYLERNGWQRGEPWGAEVRLPEGFDYARADADNRMSTARWRELGVRGVGGEPLPALDEAAIIIPAGAQGPAFMVGHNFRVIMRYNNATSYALAVAILSDRIKGRPGVQASWPRSLKLLSRSQTLELQQALNRAGFDTGTPDGIMGPNTRAALRAWQRSRGETPDGFASVETLERLR